MQMADTGTGCRSYHRRPSQSIALIWSICAKMRQSFPATTVLQLLLFLQCSSISFWMVVPTDAFGVRNNSLQRQQQRQGSHPFPRTNILQEMRGRWRTSAYVRRQELSFPMSSLSSSSSSPDEDRQFARLRRERSNWNDDGRERKSSTSDPDTLLDDDEDNWTYANDEEEEDRDGDDDYDLYDDDDEENEEEYELFGDVLIPNPLLDSMDPDGAAERFPELARDPRFWFDMLLFVAFLDFLSYAGPRDPFPDFPM